MTGAEAWEPGSSLPHLELGEVHVWRAALRVLRTRLPQLGRSLSRDEEAHAERFRVPELRERFIAGRAIQRDILSRYLGTRPEAIEYCYSARGKPDVCSPIHTPAIRFNASNSGGMALYALAAECAVGVDLEEVRPMPEVHSMIRHVLSPREIATFQSIPECDREAAFLRCWTRKEAFAKALGLGLGMPLDQIEVAFAPDEPARLLHRQGFPSDAERWTLRRLDVGDQYVAALAVEGAIRQLRLFSWS